jgi:hypothetical protein
MLLETSGFIQYNIFTSYMSILNKFIPNNKQIQTPDANNLSAQELELLLNALKTTTIVGEQVELFYNLVVKLQNQYIELQK